MKAVVVYESLWGNTAAIARAIAEGLGPEARALSTAEATSEAMADADLIVAGAPVHSLSLPTDRTREWARAGNLGPGGAPPDLSHPEMRTWLDGLRRGHGRSAAFDTRVKAWYGRGAASKILKGLKRAGYKPIAKPRGFFVGGHRLKPTADGTLRDGEIERARQWGAELARAME
ncbi:MAG: Flavodoxin [Acetothermia bacterium 64_32]|nr:MAG: Flavodoxin [Acetothermia bacterium 64_32]HAF70119.1 flavodoxin [Candidatus Acetothermia bacterium]